MPGNGLTGDNVNAALCTSGSYSYGYARRPCVTCPAALTTASQGSRSKWFCGAHARRLHNP